MDALDQMPSDLFDMITISRPSQAAFLSIDDMLSGLAKVSRKYNRIVLDIKNRLEIKRLKGIKSRFEVCLSICRCTEPSTITITHRRYF